MVHPPTLTLHTQCTSVPRISYLETQKQIQSLADGLQHIQQLLLQQQPTALPTASPKNSDNTPQTLLHWAPPPALPSVFDGDCSKGQAFLCSCQTYILLCPESFSNDQMKIVWALSCMKLGRAAKWADRIFKWEEENEGYTKFLDWDNFKSEFCKEFCPANSNSAMINKLESTTYDQRTQSVDDYLDEFLDLNCGIQVHRSRDLGSQIQKGARPTNSKCSHNNDKWMSLQCCSKCMVWGSQKHRSE